MMQLDAKNQYRIKVLIFILSFLLYANSIFNSYALDDFGLLINNSLTNLGIKGIFSAISSGYRTSLDFKDVELYRPIPRLFYQLYAAFANQNPILPHFINVLLFAIGNVLLFQLLSNFFQGLHKLSFLVCLVFLFHPIHTEVVANAKGLEELLQYVFLLLMAKAHLNYHTNKGVSWLILGNIYFLLALLSKESAISFAVLMPIAFVAKEDGKNTGWLKMLISLVLTSGLYLALRFLVIAWQNPSPSISENYLFFEPNIFGRCIGAFYILLYYIKQILLPIQLISDASFHHFLFFREWGAPEWFFFVGLLIFLVVGIIYFGLKSKFSFGIAFYFLSIFPVSNLLLPIGTHYAERLLFLPSLGLIIALVYGIGTIAKIDLSKTISFEQIFHLKSTESRAFLIFLLGFSFLTIQRNAQWKNNYTLFSSDIEKVPESARMNVYYASTLSSPDYLETLKSPQQKQQALKESIAHFSKALTIDTTFERVSISMANIYNQLQMYKEADSLYRLGLGQTKFKDEYLLNYGDFLFSQRRLVEAENIFKQCIATKPNHSKALSNLGSVYAQKGQIDTQFTKLNFDTALFYYEKAISIDATLPDPYYYAYQIYAYKGEVEKATKFQQQYQLLIKKKHFNPYKW